MKSRIGFVSNSSSTSFVLYGIRLNYGEEEKADEIAEATGLKVKYGEDSTYVGLVESGENEHSIIGDMRDDETRAQFQKRVDDAFISAGIQDKAEWWSESWYNG